MWQCETSSLRRTLPDSCDRSDLLTNLGLRASSTFGAQIPNYAPHFLIGNFLMTYVFFSTRPAKLLAKIDDNISPRGDLIKADRAVKEGKLTQERLDQIKRLQSAHENGMEHYSVFVGALAMAVSAHVDNATVNKYALIYTVVRAAYTASYYYLTTKSASRIRSVLWWAGNITCIRLLWFAGQSLNSPKVI